MANTDEHGNKIPQTRIKKKDFSYMLRERRMQSVVDGRLNPAFCNMCGFRVRSLNHKSGRHHQTAPKVIEVNRQAAMA